MCLHEFEVGLKLNLILKSIHGSISFLLLITRRLGLAGDEIMFLLFILVKERKGVQEIGNRSSWSHLPIMYQGGTQSYHHQL